MPKTAKVNHQIVVRAFCPDCRWNPEQDLYDDAEFEVCPKAVLVGEVQYEGMGSFADVILECSAFEEQKDKQE